MQQDQHQFHIFRYEWLWGCWEKLIRRPFTMWWGKTWPSPTAATHGVLCCTRLLRRKEGRTEWWREGWLVQQIMFQFLPCEGTQLPYSLLDQFFILVYFIIILFSLRSMWLTHHSHKIGTINMFFAILIVVIKHNTLCFISLQLIYSGWL